MNPPFVLKYGVSKKGNRTVTVCQVKTEEYPFVREQGFSCSQKYKDVIKIKNQADREYYSPYLNMTVEEVFEVAVKLQEWRLIPFKPITEHVCMMYSDEVCGTDYSLTEDEWNN